MGKRVSCEMLLLDGTVKGCIQGKITEDKSCVAFKLSREAAAGKEAYS